MNDLEGLLPEQIEKISKARERVIDSIGKNMDLYGITLSIGHLYGYMYFKEGPVTLDELSSNMGMSKTSMSTGVRTLLDLKMIDKVWGKGTRKDLFEVVPDWHQNFSDYFSIKWRKAVEGNMTALNKSLAEIRQMKIDYADEPDTTRLLQTDEIKIEEAIKYYRWLLKLIESLETGKIFELIPKE
ncbi:GbsR/MarR family transcriptional regulator [Paenibacillus tritici]|jgi:HTH-type transcriptional regulator, glycine betaine synthesis regulator|uniref:HTH-type transcriptional regulator n=1 Tax=Paenibacillus tritici TaxID=1873425 RepID=A0ABX2DNF6_9BACL|nr:GbsR/MarR family transcriptional regulator [Paenibacillus tritici]NQX45634.1 GbsR/MarR family transcriptional regulator [Paenibacillus tritici]